jgi:hypothetical protein
MYPFSEEELEELYGRAVQRDQRLADILLVDAWTGLRWSELRAVRVRDLVEVPLPVLVVQRAEPEGVQVKGTKSGRSRRVPPLVRSLTVGREPDDLLCVTTSGHRLHASAFKRTLTWATIADGRRIHDLRHTAACLWLARGVDPVTVQAWMGHASIATTNLYLHHLGTAADRAGLDRLNRGGTQGAHVAWSSPNDTLQIRERFSVSHLVRACYWTVELRGLEPLTFSLRTRRATNCAIAPRTGWPISIETLPPSGRGGLWRFLASSWAWRGRCR